jgi:hypothetical protein
MDTSWHHGWVANKVELAHHLTSIEVTENNLKAHITPNNQSHCKMVV